MNEPDEGAPFIPSPKRIAEMSRRIKIEGLEEKRSEGDSTSYVKPSAMRLTRVVKTNRARGKQEVD